MPISLLEPTDRADADIQQILELEKFIENTGIHARYSCMNSGYNGLAITLRVMMVQFEKSNKISKEIELNKRHWSYLFQLFHFFKTYKNYLKVDVVAGNRKDLIARKGWVESPLRQLTLKIERDTNRTLQCHPCPSEYSNNSKQWHRTYYMELIRKEKVTRTEEGGPFDIHTTVDEFKQLVNMYIFRKPGIKFNTSHWEQISHNSSFNSVKRKKHGEDDSKMKKRVFVSPNDIMLPSKLMSISLTEV